MSPDRRPSARAVAYEALVRIDTKDAYANLVVPALLERSGLDDRDRRFVTELVYGTTRMRRACDHLVDRFLVTEPDPKLRAALRLGAHQLHHLGLPAHAAVGETVAVVPPRWRGVVNAVLRKVAAADVSWPSDAVRLSYPDWLVHRLTDELGHLDAIAALERMNQPPPVTERADGYVQDLASTWVADLVEAGAGQRVADLCAAPGGKATRLAGAVAPGGVVVATDARRGRLGLVQANGRRLGVGDRLVIGVGDATRPPLRPGAFDHVLLDAPCSGLGALRRRPDARWRITPAAIESLAAVQRQMLDAAVALVRPGGTLVYSVCTLTAAESIDHDRGELSGLDVLAPAPPWEPYGRGGRVLPQHHDTDGMIVLRWRIPG